MVRKLNCEIEKYGKQIDFPNNRSYKLEYDLGKIMNDLLFNLIAIKEIDK